MSLIIMAWIYIMLRKHGQAIMATCSHVLLFKNLLLSHVCRVCAHVIFMPHIHVHVALIEPSSRPNYINRAI